MEDAYLFSVLSLAGRIELSSNMEDAGIPLTVRVMLRTWAELREKYMCGEISKEEYDQWRYNFPNIPKDEYEII